VVQWVNALSGNEVRIRWKKAPSPSSACVPPAGVDAPADGQEAVLPPLPTVSSFQHTDDGTPPGLDLDTTYCYSLFVLGASGWSKGRTVHARPFSDAGPLKWAFSTGATAVVPPAVGTEGIVVMSNDRTVHSLTRGGAAGGRWPAGWVPYPLTGVAHSRSPVVPFVATSSVFPGRSILFAAGDMGDVHAIDAANGQPVWRSPQDKPIVGAPGGIFRQYGGIADLIIVGTRDTSGPNELRGLAAADGSLVGTAFTAGGTIGAISGSPAIDYATQRVYFTSRSHGGAGSTIWCVEVDGTTPFVPCTGWTARNLGDVDGSPVVRGGRVYLGTNAGNAYSLSAATGLDERTFSTGGDGAVKGFLFPDRRNDDLIFATNTRVWSVSDAGAAEMVENWQWTAAGLNPSLVLYWPETNLVYVGSRNGALYELDFTLAGSGTPPQHDVLVLGDGLAQLGAPSLDIGVAPPDVTPGKKLLVVGSESGTLYGLEVPF
jgi:outer membrane protein assembly factor BamB